MGRIPFTYVATGLIGGSERAVPNASVTLYEADGVTLLAQTLWSASAGGIGLANPLTSGANGATATVWLDSAQVAVVKWTATGWTGVTENVQIGAGTSGTPSGPAGGALSGTFPSPGLANGAATGAALGPDVAKVNLTSVADGDMLVYLASAAKFQNYPRPERTFEFFGGSKTGTLTAQTNAWTAARTWSDSVVGGNIIFGAGTYQHMPKLELGNHMGIIGAGMLATRLQFDASITTGACVFNHVSTNGTTDPNAWGVHIEHLTVDCSQLPGWGTNAVNGITLNQNPTFSKATADSGELLAPDTAHTVRNVLIYLAPQDGCAALAMGEQHWEMVKSYQSGRYGFQPPFDSTIFNCTAAFSNKEGFFITGTPVKLVGCKAFSNGNVTHANGQGFHIATSGGLAPVTLAACEAQDNWAAGFFVDGCTGALVSLVGCIADSNSVRGIGTDPAYDILNSPRAKLVACSASERNANGVNQIHAVSLRGTSTAVHVEMEHQGTNSSTVSSPFQTIDSTAGASFCSVNNLQGFQSNFSASFSPDFFAGGTVETLGLASNATVGAPANGPYPPGTQARFIFKQNATGGFTITWNAAYVNTPTTNTAPNAYTVARFVYDGTSWVGL